MSPKKRSLKNPSELLARKIVELAASKKAEEITLLDLHKLTSITDFFIICTGNSDVQVKAISDAIVEGMKSEVKPWHIEGRENLRWVLLDFVDVVVHIFHREERDFYQLERLWADAPTEVIESEDTPVSATSNSE
ncbi:MAG: ribosome silencing factor [Candidatus Marinimicrobia bacterium]|nr:ribosome silencing factor [Candidatus Neomarinimicrobiota bacterium]